MRLSPNYAPESPGDRGGTMLRRISFIMALVALVPAAFAQRGGGRGAAGQTVEKIKMLKPNLYEITGGGANTLIRVTNQGLIVVDTKNPPNSPTAAAPSGGRRCLTACSASISNRQFPDAASPNPARMFRHFEQSSIPW